MVLVMNTEVVGRCILYMGHFTFAVYPLMGLDKTKKARKGGWIC